MHTTSDRCSNGSGALQSPCKVLNAKPVQAMSESMGWKRTKGKKKGKALQPDLSRIYGYINDVDENDAEAASNTLPVSGFK